MRGVVLLLCMAFCCVACVSAPAGQPVASQHTVRAVQERYVIQPGDILDLKFFYNPELNETVMVRPDGRISVQLAPEVKAAGVTPEELRKALMERYGKEVNRPDVAVILRSFSQQRVYVDGEVARPGMLPLVGPVTIHQAVAAAGGFLTTAKRTDVVIVRQIDGRPVPLKVNMEDVLLNQDPAKDVLLAPFDIVYVPRSSVAEVNKAIDLYIRRNLPIGLGAGVGWTINQ